MEIRRCFPFEQRSIHLWCLFFRISVDLLLANTIHLNAYLGKLPLLLRGKPKYIPPGKGTHTYLIPKNIKRCRKHEPDFITFNLLTTNTCSQRIRAYVRNKFGAKKTDAVVFKNLMWAAGVPQNLTSEDPKTA